ncbi:potassium channel subfamily K member 18-like [Amphibalanus amphitrite]|uniref:potassium channel subfamily K member 18-like n=1 Tax=Amphibalanus amphitrite TaxID=1232801 RepID=UPI001C917F97|nr:potassium channel subfamily K member 18-like [Amphibalanus amphitrite]XP_043230728.1 potassium channel subfamily K member 18-like [Amphibalanus amphitrite]XP_043230729.1 potassium channel subfamily K member 18-like [Amphibalanus amphitrite]
MTPFEEVTARPARGQRRCATCCQRVWGTICSNFGICLIILGYIVMGAFLFSHVEGSHEAAERDRVHSEISAVHHSVSQSRLRTVEKLWNITVALNVLHKENWTHLMAIELKKFQADLIQASKRNHTAPPPEQWSFFGSFLYSLTIITTIGYGTCSPKTDAGKLLTIAYAVMGIPLMLLYLSNVGDIMARCFKLAFGGACVCRRPAAAASLQSPSLHNRIPELGQTSLNHLDGELKRAGEPPWPWEEVGPLLPPPEPRAPLLPFCACLTIIIGYILAGGYMLTFWEDWSYMDGAFFCFVSLSTIGFGELTPGSSQLAAALYLLLGMALIAVCCSLLQEQLVALAGCLARALELLPERGQPAAEDAAESAAS